MPDLGLVVLSLGTVVSVCLSTFFSFSETALLTASRTKLRFLADQGDDGARRALLLLQRPRRLLATILIGNTVVNIVASVLATVVAIRLFGSWAPGIATGVMAFVLLVVGEISPKTFANEHAVWAARHVATPVRVFVYAFLPLERALNWIARLLLRLVGTGRVKPVQFHTEEEIKVLLRIGREQGHIGQHEDKLIRAVFEFNDLELSDIVRPAAEVVSVRPSDRLTRISQVVAQSGHSRFPVLDEADGKPVGLLYSKDLLLMTPDQLRGLTVASVLRAIPRFPPETRVTHALETLRSEGSHLAAVVDVAGAMIGIVTVEDLLEEIVGEITDEYEVARRNLKRERARLFGGPPGAAPAHRPSAQGAPEAGGAAAEAPDVGGP